MATVTATQTAPVRTGATAGAGQAGGSSDTGFGALLAALVPGGAATGGAPGTTTAPAPTPAGVCGAGPEVSVSTDEAVVGAADSTQVVVGATGDDTAGSRTGDPGTGTASETTDGTDATASGPTADPVLGVDAALLAQAQLAALPLLAATNPVTPVVAPGSLRGARPPRSPAPAPTGPPTSRPSSPPTSSRPRSSRHRPRPPPYRSPTRAPRRRPRPSPRPRRPRPSPRPRPPARPVPRTPSRARCSPRSSGSRRPAPARTGWCCASTRAPSARSGSP